MTNSVTEVTCRKCSHIFTGVLNDLFNVSKEYAATCPSCKSETFFNPGAAFIDIDIPKDAVTIKYVAKL
ncbi:hypothetical protein [Shewanella baltica]|uniref:hypothetical protein n=1 Tax=Shewanella baltica TaxID=62322 RepID=UPI00131DFEB2|nr:hypothetical protein [Shewanella baltica]